MGGLEEELSRYQTGPALREAHDHMRWMQQLPIILGGQEYPQHFAEESHPLLEHNWILRRLGGIYQLAQIRYLLSAADHTRQVHSLDSAAMTSHFLRKLVHEAPELATIWDEIVMHAVLHDGGHWAGGHVVEALLKRIIKKDHKQLGIEALDMIGPDGRIMSLEMQKHGINADTVKALMGGKHEAACIVADRTLGAEKIAYLIRDRERHPLYGRIPAPDIIVNSLAYCNGKVGLRSPNIYDISRWADINDTHQLAFDLGMFFVRQYANLYLSPQSQLVSRHLQRMVEAVLETGLTTDELWRMGDSELTYAAVEAGGKAAKEHDNLAHNALTPSKLALRLQGYGTRRFPQEEVYIVDDETSEKAGDLFEHAPRLNKIEETFSKQWNADIAVTAVPVDHRFKPYSVTFFDKNTTYTLAEALPHYEDTVRKTMRGVWAIRVHTHDTLPKNAGAELADYIKNN